MREDRVRRRRRARAPCLCQGARQEAVDGRHHRDGARAWRSSASLAGEAAANHLVRELAIEMAPLVRVNAVAPATVVKGSTMFPRDRVIASLTKYEIPFSEDDPTDELRDKLAAFYARRSLTQTPIEPEDQAEAIFLLLSARLSKTTGHVIPVDGGLQDGFLR